ncbi:MAG TPA: glycosyltransferase family 2 protein [Myxococcota bacterium]|nr:glycosyltransferase family 2 protein [Myxococcota bacterium]
MRRSGGLDSEASAGSAGRRAVDPEGSRGPTVLALVLNWNGADDTLACLQSLKTQSWPGLQALVLDNGSSDDSVRRIQAAFPEVEIESLGSNLGYAGGQNAGLRAALGRGAVFALVLNNDTVLEAECVERLVDAAMRHPEAAALAPKSLLSDPPGTVYFAGGGWDPSGYPRMIGFGRPDGPEYSRERETDWLNGCALLVRCEALERIGLFDERFFLTFEDTDWSLRARAAGHRLRLVPEARLVHHASRSFGSSRTPTHLYYYTRNHLLFVSIHARGLARIRGFWGVFTRARRALKRARKQSPEGGRRARRALLRATRDFWLGWLGPERTDESG